MQSFSTPVRVPDDVLPHRLDGHGHAVVLGTFHHRFQAADEALQGFLPVGGGIVLVFDVRRAGLRSDHPRAADLRDPHAAVVAFLHFRKLYRVRIRQVQIAPQHGALRFRSGESSLHRFGEAGIGQFFRRFLHAEARYGLAQRQVRAFEALAFYEPEPFFQGALDGVVQPDADFHILSPPCS